MNLHKTLCNQAQDLILSFLAHSCWAFSPFIWRPSHVLSFIFYLFILFFSFLLFLPSPSNFGLLDPSTSDGRVIFFLPWEGNTLVGTTDQPCEIDFDPKATEDEVNFILKELEKYLRPGLQVTKKDILSTWSGIRPLVKDPSKANTESLVRNHVIFSSPSNLITVAGGKWTTYRSMAEETVDEAIKLLKVFSSSWIETCKKTQRNKTSPLS